MLSSAEGDRVDAHLAGAVPVPARRVVARAGKFLQTCGEMPDRVASHDEDRTGGLADRAEEIRQDFRRRAGLIVEGPAVFARPRVHVERIAPRDIVGREVVLDELKAPFAQTRHVLRDDFQNFGMRWVERVRHVPQKAFAFQRGIVEKERTVPDAGADAVCLHLFRKMRHIREVDVSAIPRTEVVVILQTQFLPAVVHDHERTVFKSGGQLGEVAAVFQNARFGDIAVGVIPVVAAVNRNGGENRIRTELRAELPCRGIGADAGIKLARDFRDGESASVQQHAASAGTEVAPESDPVGVGGPCGETAGTDLDSARGNRGIGKLGEEVPRHHAGRLEAAPVGVSVSPFPCIAAETCSGGKFVLPAHAQKAERNRSGGNFNFSVFKCNGRAVSGRHAPSFRIKRNGIRRFL